MAPAAYDGVEPAVIFREAVRFAQTIALAAPDAVSDRHQDCTVPQSSSACENVIAPILLISPLVPLVAFHAPDVRAIATRA